jgi:predicted Ser/Thr protein kinase
VNALLLSLILFTACGPSSEERHGLSQAAAQAEAQLIDAERLRKTAVEVQEDAARSLAESVRGELQAESALDGALWSKRRITREDEKRLADISLGEARSLEGAAADAYLAAEQQLRSATGAYHDADLHNSWRKRRAGAVSVKGYRTSGPPFAFGMLVSGLGAALLMVGYIGFTRRRRDRTPSIRVHRNLDAIVEIPLLAGRYRLKNAIGRGGFGRVWDGEAASSGRRVAVKQMREDLGGNFKFARSLYLKEARTLAQLHHPNIVEFIESVDREGILYLVFEYVEGKTLQQVLAERKHLPWSEARALLLKICDALAFAHERGIIHRDLKPANIMLTKEGGVKVMDFGISRALAESGEKFSPADEGGNIAHTRNLYGTPAYTCPEAAQGIVSRAADIYSLGVCLYETLTGVLPFGSDVRKPGTLHEPATSFAPDLPPGIDPLLDRMLEPDRDKRTATAADLARELKAF